MTAGWAGETYLNLVWQNEMVEGMLTGFLVTLAIVLVLLVALFRSVVWALIGISVARAGNSLIVISTWVAALAVLIGLGWSRVGARNVKSDVLRSTNR